jgi:hypothetical protein
MRHGTATEDTLARYAVDVLSGQHHVAKPHRIYTPSVTIRPDLYYLGASADRVVQFTENGETYLVGLVVHPFRSPCLLRT